MSQIIIPCIAFLIAVGIATIWDLTRKKHCPYDQTEMQTNYNYRRDHCPVCGYWEKW